MTKPRFRRRCGALLVAGLTLSASLVGAGGPVDRASATPSGTGDLAAHRAMIMDGPTQTGPGLEQVQAALNRYAARYGAGQVQNWYIDAPRDSVVMTVRAGAHDASTRAFIEFAKNRGSRLRVERAPGRTRSAAYLYGGQAMGLSNGKSCSIGFNASTSDGMNIFLTAGHCTNGWPVASRYGVRIGRTAGRSFPVNDYAAISINRPGIWNPRGAVVKYDGYARTVRGHRTPPVGSRVCKGGETTGWTCGTIQSYHQTVNYGNGNIVYGLVRFSACVEPGDSGGAVMWGSYAVGIVSGAQYFGGGASSCGQRVGRRSVSFYQPVGEALNAYDASLVTYPAGRS